MRAESLSRRRSGYASLAMSDAGEGGGRELARSLGRIGAWSFALDELPSRRRARRRANRGGARVRSAVVPGEAGSKEAFSRRRAAGRDGAAPLSRRASRHLGTRRLRDGERRPRAVGRLPGRFLLGIGISHAPSVKARGHDTSGRCDHARVPGRDGRGALTTRHRASAGRPGCSPPYGHGCSGWRRNGRTAPTRTSFPFRTRSMRAAVLGTRAVAGRRADGRHATDATRRRRGRSDARSPTHYLELTNYANNLLRLGFDEDDVAGDGSDRVIDAVIAWGDEEAIARRVREHLDAGATTSVCRCVGSIRPTRDSTTSAV